MSLRILLINQFFPPDVAATGQLLEDVATALVHRGHEVHVICSQRTYGGNDRLHQSGITEEGVRVHRMPSTGFGRGTLLGQATDFVSFYVLAVAKALSLPRMDVCICLTTPPFIAGVGMILRYTRGTKLLLWMMDLYPDLAVALGVLRRGSLVHRVLAAVSREFCRRSAGIIALGSFMSRRLAENGVPPELLTVVHNWVPGERVSPTLPEQSPLRNGWAPDGNTTLMYSGNLGRGHQLETIVWALAKVDRCIPIRTLFVGQGNRRQPLERLVHEQGLRSVQFLPPQPLSRLSDCLAAADIHFATQNETTQGISVPSKIYGILAAGRPIIFIGPGDCEAAQILRDSGAGIAVAPGAVQGTAEAICSLVGEPCLRSEMGRKARAYYDLHFGLSRSVGRIVGMVETAGGCPGPSQGRES